MHTPLRIEGLSLTYPGAPRPAVDGVDLHVRPGECLALLGPNGAGKTTLIRAATGLLTPDSGIVEVAGGSPHRADVRARMGVMLQATAFPTHLTVHELVVGAAARAGASPGDAARTMDELGIADLAARRSHELSGGQRRRLQLARALVVDPELLILDEPTEGLDLDSRRATWRLLAARRDAGTAILLTTHLVSEAGSVADRVAVISGGRIVANDTPDVLADRLPDRTIHAHTRLASARLADLPGVVHVERTGLDDSDRSRRGRTTIVTRQPEDVLRQLLALDPGLHGLRVVGASLEDAVLAIGATPATPATPTPSVPATSKALA